MYLYVLPTRKEIWPLHQEPALDVSQENKHIPLVCVCNRLVVFPKHLQSHLSGSFRSFYTHLEMTETDIKAVREMIIKLPAFLSNKFAVGLLSDSFER